MSSEGHEPVAVSPHSGAEDPAPDQPKSEAPAPPSFIDECYEKLYSLTLLLSILSVACWALAGNACRLALHSAFLGIPYLPTYEFFGPNCIGSFAMGFFGTALPTEAEMPLLVRALCVGFCGSFTTFSSWVVDVTNKDSAAASFAELVSGLTMPFVFFIFGRDVGRALRAMVHRVGAAICSQEAEEEEEEHPPTPMDEVDKTSTAATRQWWYTRFDLTFLIVSVLAAIAAPIGVTIRVQKGKLEPITREDMYAVVMAPSGAVPRFLLSVLLNKRPAWRSFPVGTLAANALGCFLDVFMENFRVRRPWNSWYWIVGNGLCGALSTVSSFVNEVVGFYAADRLWMTYGYCLVTLMVTMTIGAVGRRSNYD